MLLSEQLIKHNYNQNKLIQSKDFSLFHINCFSSINYKSLKRLGFEVVC